LRRNSPVLRPLRTGEGLVRGRFEIEYRGSKYVVDSLYVDLDERIRLYRDGHLVDSARRRAAFPLSDGSRIEVAVAQVGMKYVRLRHGESGDITPLSPVDGTAEAWRARVGRAYPGASRVVDKASLVVVLAVLVIELPQLINLLGNMASLVGLPTFEVPALNLSGWANAALILIGGAAGLERSLSMRFNPVLDD